MNERAPAFDDLVGEALTLIPAYAPAWTNHNASDPGITLIELLAYYSEALAYRADRISPDAKLNFLRLLHGEAWSDWQALVGRPVSHIDAEIDRQVASLAHACPAVTSADFERRAVEVASEWLGEGNTVQARSVPSAELLAALGREVGGSISLGDITVILAPERALAVDHLNTLRMHVQQQLEPLCLLTSRVHVMEPVYLNITVGAHLGMNRGVRPEEAIDAANEALRRRFGPALPSDPPNPQNRFGRPVHLSEIVEVVDGADGVDYAEHLHVRSIDPGDHALQYTRVGVRIGVASRIGDDTNPGGDVSRAFNRFSRDAAGEATTVELRPWELARVRLDPEGITLTGGRAEHGH
jgi:hypothetical protein